MIGEFIMKAMHTRTNAHVLHLKSRSYAQHVALGGFYEGLIDLIDQYAEAYQGAFGLIDEYPGRYTFVDDPLKLVESFCGYVDENREELSQDEDSLENILDEICALCQQTTYKLRFLK